MAVLCLDTATTTCVAALLDLPGDDVRTATFDGRAQQLLVVVEELCRGIDRSGIDAVAVGVGPGGFTGLRVGVSMARGIAEALDVPLIAVSSLLAAAARAAHDAPGARVWATIDARRGEWFAQPFMCDPTTGAIEPLEPARTVADADVDMLVGSDLRVSVADPSSLARAVAAARAAGSIGSDPALVVPDYGRDPDAEPPRIEWQLGDLVDADLDALVHLERRCFATPWTRGMYAAELARSSDDAVRIGARDMRANDRLVGAALAARIGDFWHVMNVLVDPIARRRGIASTLMHTLLQRTAELGAGDGWTLEVRDGNDGAISLYEEHGFIQVGRRPGYYADSGEDAVIMSRGTA